MMVVLQLLLNKLHNQGIFQKTELEYPFSHFTVFSFVNPHFSSACSKGCLLYTSSENLVAHLTKGSVYVILYIFRTLRFYERLFDSLLKAFYYPALFQIRQ